jgi:hypothetical protein
MKNLRSSLLCAALLALTLNLNAKPAPSSDIPPELMPPGMEFLFSESDFSFSSSSELDLPSPGEGGEEEGPTPNYPAFDFPPDAFAITSITVAPDLLTANLTWQGSGSASVQPEASIDYGTTWFETGAPSTTLAQTVPTHGDWAMYRVKMAAPSPGSYRWANKMGGPNSSSAAGGYSTAVDGPGNVYVTGNFAGTVNFGGDPLVSAGNGDIFVAKYSATGAHLWSKRFGNTGTDISYSLGLDNLGNVLITGTYAGSIDFGTGEPLLSVGSSDMFVAKLNGDGDVLWAKSYGSTGADNPFNIVLDGQNNIVFSGFFGFFGGPIDFGNSFVLTSAGGRDIFVAKLNSDGDTLWAIQFGGPDDDTATGLAINKQDNSVLVTGSFRGSASFGSTPLTSLGGNDIFLTRLSAAGIPLWAQRFGSNLDENPGGVAVDNTGNIAINGNFRGTVNFGSGPLTYHGQSDLYLAQFTPGGSCLWSKNFGSSFGGDQFLGVTCDNTGNIVVNAALATAIDLGGQWSFPVGGSQDIAFIKYNAAGSLLWVGRFGGLGYNKAQDVATDSAGGIIGTGYFAQSADFGGGILSASPGGANAFVVRFWP